MGKEDGYYIRVTFAGGADGGITLQCVEIHALGERLMDQFGIAAISGLDRSAFWTAFSSPVRILQ